MSSQKKKFPIITVLFGLVFIAFWVTLLSGNILWTSNTPPLQVIPDMDNQFKVKSQTQNYFFADQRGERPVIEYTVPRYKTAYSVEDYDEAEEVNVNTVPRTDLVLARGKNRYEAFCAPCHNVDGAGNGPVVKKGFAAPPSLIEGNAIDYSDARIFHVISKGQNIMSSYADKLPVVDRWAVVHYIRALQTGDANNILKTAKKQSKDNDSPSYSALEDK